MDKINQKRKFMHSSKFYRDVRRYKADWGNENIRPYNSQHKNNNEPSTHITPQITPVNNNNTGFETMHSFIGG